LKDHWFNQPDNDADPAWPVATPYVSTDVTRRDLQGCRHGRGAWIELAPGRKPEGHGTRPKSLSIVGLSSATGSLQTLPDSNPDRVRSHPAALRRRPPRRV
jgi:hypothetical protein